MLTVFMVEQEGEITVFLKIQSYLSKEHTNNIMKRKEKLILSIIKKDLMIIWVGKFICFLIINTTLLSCKADNHWTLPSDISSIDRIIDSILIKQKNETSKDLLDKNFMINVSKNYTLKGTIINDLKIGWWVFNGMNDSLKIEYINIKDKPFKNQLILYNKESID